MHRLTATAIAVLAAVAASVQAQTPRDLEDLVDMRARTGERELEDRGYRHYKTTKIRDSSIAYWWNSREGRCIAATTKDGRYASILDQSETMCGEDPANSGGHPRGGHFSIDDLVGMRASRGERKFKDLGYHHRNAVKVRDNSIAYWWKPRERHCIAVTTKDGRYSSVVDQPQSMCDDDRASSSRHHGGGHGSIDGLVGMRASSGEHELKDRGYKFVNSRKGSGRIWANWWNQSKRKCITVVTMDGRHDSITDTQPADCNRQ